MKEYILYIVIFLLICVVIASMIVHRFQEQFTFDSQKLNLIEHDPNSLSSYFTLEKSKSLEHTNALVMKSSKLTGYLYWSVRGFNDKDNVIKSSNVGDSISSSRTKLSVNDTLVVIMCSDLRLFNSLKDKISKDYFLNGGLYQIYVEHIPIYEGGEYNIVSQTIKRDNTEITPEWECTLYTKTSHNIICSSRKKLITRDDENSERELITDDVWDIAIDNIISASSFNVIREIDVTDEATQPIDFFENRDMAVFGTGAVTLEPNQSVVVICLDHSKTRKAFHSTVDFYQQHLNNAVKFRSDITGDYILKGLQIQKGEVAAKILKYDYITSDPFVIVESICSDFKTTVAPRHHNLHKMKVFIIYSGHI
jgi:hypothetical protein